MQSVKKLFQQYPRFTIVSIIILALIGAVIVSSLHGASTPAKKTNAQSSSSQATSSPTARTVTPSTQTQATLTGFGALYADWNSAHTQDPSYAQNEVYDATPGLGIDSSHTDKYYAVVHTNGRVTNYEMRLPNGNNLAASQKEVMQEFPADASILWQQTKGECSQMEVSSTMLGSVLGNPGSSGQVFAEFQTDTAATESQFSYYNPSNVNMATLSQQSYAVASDAPGC